MPHPTQRHTKSRRDKRRSQQKLAALPVTHCAKCKRSVPMHQACSWCGTYRGREVIDVLAKLDKKERKKIEKEIKESQKEQQHSDQSQNLETLSRKSS